ncbi:MAG: sugar phosphate nucleotidyltransferase [Salinivirgaceae bacterium]
MIVIIPARGGSKGLPGKNIKELCGKPLLAYTIEAALKSKNVRRVIVSTDDIEIAAISEKYGAEVPFLRPADLATDSAKAIDNYIYTIDRLNKDYQLNIKDFVVLQPTSPLRTSEDIDNAISIFKEKKAEAVISMHEAPHPPAWAKKIVKGLITDYFTVNIDNTNRQDLDIAYMPNGAIYVFKISLLKEKRTYFSDKTFAYIMPTDRSIDIDNKMDFEFVEYLINKENQRNNENFSINKNIVNLNCSIREAIKHLDKTGNGFIALINESNKVKGVLTDGDFRRAILKGISLDDAVIDIANKTFTFVNQPYTKEEIQNIFNNNRINQIPVLDNFELVDIIFRNTFNYLSFSENDKVKLNIPVVIMAGGKGTRMKPFTNILPKPLIPIGEKTMLEVILNEYAKYGISEFYLSINYKGNMIKAYFQDVPTTYSLNYIEETEPLGTAGSLKLIQKKINTPFFVSNCDILVKGDYDKMYDFHIQGGFDLTVIGTMQHHQVPYGVCEIEQGGKLLRLTEKPDYDYLVNTGMYILNPSVLSFIPDNKFYHITHVIEQLMKDNKKVGVYPVSEKSWIDIGQWVEYEKNINQF